MVKKLKRDASPRGGESEEEYLYSSARDYSVQKGLVKVVVALYGRLKLKLFSRNRASKLGALEGI